MAVDGAVEIIPIINRLRETSKFELIVRARDWHPKEHVSFQSNNPGSDLFEEVRLPSTGKMQTMWPDHCIQGTVGAQYHKDLKLAGSDIEISKGALPYSDSISAFGSEEEDTGLVRKLKEVGITKVYCVGLAYDFCVGYTAEDAADHGFETFVIKDAARSVNAEDESSMNRRMQAAGVKIVMSDSILKDIKYINS